MLRYWPAFLVAAIGMFVVVAAMLVLTPDPSHSAFASDTGNNYVGGLAVLGTCAALLVTGWKTYILIEKPRTNR
jgi:peptidoglycan/LPS O-acetylase OafA/YrhL